MTNINRQLIAMHSTIGRPKTDVAAERMLDINPDVRVRPRHCFFTGRKMMGNLIFQVLII